MPGGADIRARDGKHFGTMHNVGLAQECARAVLIFAYGLIVLRISGRRTFAQWSAIDIVVSIIVGSSLSRAVTGSAPLWGTLAAVAVLVLLHLGISYVVSRSQKLSKLIEGDSVVLASNGDIQKANLHRHLVSLSDLSQALRGNGLDGLAAIGNTKRIELEPSGKIGIVRKEGD
jgi:uncharacterized membrane protein YcaP (DUF421 family)